MILRDSEVGLLEVWDNGERKEVPTYTCGHCNRVIAFRAERTRPRVRCKKCGRLICEKTSTCREECTPVPDLAKDHFEGPVAKRWSTWADAAMGGKEKWEATWL